MILKKDEYGRTIKEAESAEDYLLLEIERLKAENEELKDRLQDKTFNWVLWNKTPNAKYLMELKDGKLSIEEIKKVDDK